MQFLENWMQGYLQALIYLLDFKEQSREKLVVEVNNKIYYVG